MKTQCPTCKEIQEIPDTYKDQQVKCTACNAPFTANVLIDPKSNSHRKRISPVSDRFFTCLAHGVVAVILSIVALSVVACGLASFAGGSLAAIQYLLAVAAFCLVLIAIEFFSKNN